MTILLIVVALVVVTAVAVFAVGDSGRMRVDEPDREPADLPDDRALAASDIDRVRFALGVRGYRMDQVDDVLDRFTAELTRRDHYEAALAEQVRGLGAEPVAAPAAIAGEPSVSEASEDSEVPEGEVEEGKEEPSQVAVEPVSPDAGEHG